jgi:hypothetical protein
MLSGNVELMLQRFVDPHRSSTAVLNVYIITKQMQAQHKTEPEPGG